jgi:hypothetical protein
MQRLISLLESLRPLAQQSAGVVNCHPEFGLRFLKNLHRPVGGFEPDPARAEARQPVAPSGRIPRCVMLETHLHDSSHIVAERVILSMT